MIAFLRMGESPYKVCRSRLPHALKFVNKILQLYSDSSFATVIFSFFVFLIHVSIFSLFVAF